MCYVLSGNERYVSLRNFLSLTTLSKTLTIFRLLLSLYCECWILLALICSRNVNCLFLILSIIVFLVVIFFKNPSFLICSVHDIISSFQFLIYKNIFQQSPSNRPSNSAFFFFLFPILKKKVCFVIESHRSRSLEALNISNAFRSQCKIDIIETFRKIYRSLLGQIFKKKKQFQSVDKAFIPTINSKIHD